MPDYKERLFKEKIDLDKKAEALSKFIGLSDEFESIEREHQNLLREQCEIMWQYSEVLGKRIALLK